MTQSYKIELRTNRQRFLDDLHDKYGRLPPDVERYYLRKMTAIQNETRGKIGELFGEVSLTATGQAEEIDITRDAVTFVTPFGKRRVDVWHIDRKHALEIKSGYACLNKFVRNQIQKDDYLLREGIVSHVSWRLINGGSRPLFRSLIKHDIEILEGWPEFGNLSSEDGKAIEGSMSLSRGEIDRG